MKTVNVRGWGETTIVISELPDGMTDKEWDEDAKTIIDVLYTRVPAEVTKRVYKMMRDHYEVDGVECDATDINRSDVLYNVQALAEAQRSTGWPESWINRHALCRDLDAVGLSVLSGPIKREVGWDAIEALVNAILDTE